MEISNSSIDSGWTGYTPETSLLASIVQRAVLDLKEGAGASATAQKRFTGYLAALWLFDKSVEPWTFVWCLEHMYKKIDAGGLAQCIRQRLRDIANGAYDFAPQPIDQEGYEISYCLNCDKRARSYMGSRQFCSRACELEFKEKAWLMGNTDVHCKQCGKLCKLSDKFCSKECEREWSMAKYLGIGL